MAILCWAAKNSLRGTTTHVQKMYMQIIGENFHVYTLYLLL
jgi:hypothetical protein